MTSRNPALTFLPILLGLLAGCAWDLDQVICHPSIEARVRESLSGELAVPDPPVVPPDSFRFALFGDPQVNARLEHRLGRFARDVETLGIDFFCVLGDLTRDATQAEVDEVRRACEATGIPWYVTIGNHDLYQDDGWPRFKDEFGPSCYSITVAGRVKLVFLDTGDGTIGQTQFAWLEGQLDGDGCIKVVGTHFPCHDGTVPSLYRLGGTAERYKLQHLLQEHGVWALVSGHIHGWRHTVAGGVHHFIAGSMAPGGLDYGTPGYLLLTFAGDSLSWEKIELE